MPTKNTIQPKVGSLVRCRLTTGTFSYTTTRRVIKVRRNRFTLEGKGSPIVQSKDILAVLTTVGIS